MIGVLANEGDRRAIEEAFELFKTPWEIWQPQRRYDVVITNRDVPFCDVGAQAIIIYSPDVLQVDAELGLTIESRQDGGWLQWCDGALPIYGAVSEFRPAGDPAAILRDGSGVAVTMVAAGVANGVASSGVRVARAGFDLFAEVAFLLEKGQPSANAQIPTLDVQLSLLRALIAFLGVGFVEVLPAPAGYDFVACLSHDVDFVGIRDHKFDHTMWGFLYRCFIRSTRDAWKGRLAWAKCFRNWIAGLSLPLVFLRLLDDFWLEFDRYKEIEKGLGSTFFFIPFPGVAGMLESGPAPEHRAAKYDVTRIKNEVLDLAENGCEIGVHGLDAWRDTAKGREEKAGIQKLTGDPESGIRMHWLYWAGTSPKVLEDAGFLYDSTCGYNDAVGFRAGTGQVFRPLSAERLLELPLHIQDSALFYPDRMNLSEPAALDACRRVIQSAVAYGGTLVINWHTRSLSPERLWGEFYGTLLDEVRRRRVWFTTARQAVQWFLQRRAVRFSSVRFEDAGVHIAFESRGSDSKHGFTVRVHHPQSTNDAGSPYAYTDIEWRGEPVLSIPYPELTV